MSSQQRPLDGAKQSARIHAARLARRKAEAAARSAQDAAQPSPTDPELPSASAEATPIDDQAVSANETVADSDGDSTP